MKKLLVARAHALEAVEVRRGLDAAGAMLAIARLVDVDDAELGEVGEHLVVVARLRRRVPDLAGGALEHLAQAVDLVVDQRALLGGDGLDALDAEDVLGAEREVREAGLGDGVGRRAVHELLLGFDRRDEAVETALDAVEDRQHGGRGREALGGVHVERSP